MRPRIGERIRETEGPDLRERFAEEAAALGLTLDELIGANGKRRGRPSKVAEAEDGLAMQCGLLPGLGASR